MRGAAGDEHAASRPLEGRGMHGQQDGAAISHAYQEVHVIGDPRKLDLLSSQLTALA
jgi:hypothetical protein